MKIGSRLIAAVLLLVLHIFIPNLAFSDGPRLAKQFSFGEWGGQVVRYGDLDGDGTAEVVTAQSKGQFITSLAAFSLEGALLWTQGVPSPKRQRIGADLPIQLFDIDGDGASEILLVRNYKLQILRGRNGKVIREQKVQAKDSLHIFYRGKKPIILLKDRYTTISAFDIRLRPLWSKKTNTGHIPLSFDFDQDGKDELLIGYSLYNFRGKKLWKNLFPLHNDAADVGDMDGDGIYEIALATSQKSALLSEKGQVLWTKDHGHSQHACMGKFLHDETTDLQAAFLDRKARGTIYFYDKTGEELGIVPKQGRFTIISSVDGWTGKRNQSLLLAFRRDVGPPALFNAHGEKVVELPFLPSNPPLLTEESPEPMYRKQLDPSAYRPQYVQHFDAFGDGREEIFITNSQELWVYENSDPFDGAVEVNEGLPNKRIYNASFYMGMQ